MSLAASGMKKEVHIFLKYLRNGWYYFYMALLCFQTYVDGKIGRPCACYVIYSRFENGWFLRNCQSHVLDMVVDSNDETVDMQKVLER